MFKKKNVLFALLGIVIVMVLSACSSDSGQSSGFFTQYFVGPFISLIEWTAHLFNDNYGLGIIVVTLLIRFALLPFMLKQYKNQIAMKIKMDALKPEMDSIQKKIKQTKDPKEQQNLQKELMGLYQKHGVNPLNMGCLPLLIQMPILMAFYYAIRDSHEIATHSFLWFDLRSTRYLVNGSSWDCLLFSIQTLTGKFTSCAGRTNEIYGATISHHDRICFIQRTSSTPSLLGSRWTLPHFTNLYRA